MLAQSRLHGLSKWSDKNQESVLRVRQMIDDLMSEYLTREGKRLWCEKTPSNLAYVEALTAVFPDARYVCLYRSCLDVAMSCLQAGRFGLMSELGEAIGRHPKNLIDAMIDHWTLRTERLLELEQSDSIDTLRIRYEDLVENPDQVTSSLWRFVGVREEVDVKTRALTIPHSPGGGDHKVSCTSSIHTKSIGSGRMIPIDRISDPLRQRANRLLQQLCYPQISVGRVAVPDQAPGR